MQSPDVELTQEEPPPVSSFSQAVIVTPAWLRVNGIRIHAVEAGPADGPLVVLLHGFPEFWYGWRYQIGPLAAAGFRVVAPDGRGYNLSDKPDGVAAYSLDQLVGDVIGIVDALGREGACLVGHDWGGIVAWSAAARHPDRVRKLVVLNASHPAVIGPYLRRHPSQLLRSSYAAFFQIPSLPEWLNRRGDFAPMRRALTGTSRRGAFTRDDLDRYAESWSQPGALTGMLNWYRAAGRLGTEAANPRVQVATLVMWGMRDRFLEFGLAEASAALCDEAMILRFPEATHWLQHEEPAGANAEIISFLGAGRGGAAPTPGQDRLQPDRPEVPDIHPDIILLRDRCQPAVTVPVQIDPAPAYAVPGAEWVVAEREVAVVHRELDVMLQAGPSRRIERRQAVIVADDQVLSAVQAREDLGDPLRRGAEGEVAEMPDFVVRADRLVPACDQRLVMRLEIGEWAVIEAKRARIAEMVVAGEEDGHGRTTRRARDLLTAPASGGRWPGPARTGSWTDRVG